MKRLLTFAELARWESIKKRAALLSLQSELVSVRLYLVSVAVDFAKKNGISLISSAEILKNAALVSVAVKRVWRWISWVQSGDLGLMINGNDFDIAAPSGTNSDQILSYKNAGFGWVWVFAAGALIASSIGGLISYLWSSNDDLETKAKLIQADADSKFCKNPGSPQCVAWLERKRLPDWKGATGMIERLTDQIASGATVVSGGLGKGLMLALPVLAIYFLWGRKK
jgi:hypothetical protein